MGQLLVPGSAGVGFMSSFLLSAVFDTTDTAVPGLPSTLPGWSITAMAFAIIAYYWKKDQGRAQKVEERNEDLVEVINNLHQEILKLRSELDISAFREKTLQKEMEKYNKHKEGEG